jgi:hypothetical protein
VSAIEFGADGLQLASLELGHSDIAPALGRTDQRGVHQLQDRALAERMRDDLGAPALFTEQPLEAGW